MSSVAALPVPAPEPLGGRVALFGLSVAVYASLSLVTTRVAGLCPSATSTSVIDGASNRSIVTGPGATPTMSLPSLTCVFGGTPAMSMVMYFATAGASISATLAASATTGAAIAAASAGGGAATGFCVSSLFERTTTIAMIAAAAIAAPAT